MDKDSLAQHLLNVLASTATVAGKTINTTPLTDEQRVAELARLQNYSRPMTTEVMQRGQVGCPAAPNPQPPPQAPAVPEDGRVYLVNTYACRTAIKISGQAIYDPQVRRWYLIKPDSYNLIPPQCLPKGYKSASHKPSEDPDQPAVTKPQDSFQTWQQAGAPAPTQPAAAPASHPGTSPMIESPASRADTPRSATVLPWWPKEVRGVPNPIIRSSLFGVVKRGRREYLERVRLPTIGATEILYTGGRLDQADLDAWMGILELFKGQDIAMKLGRVTVPIREFLRIIGREAGGSGMQWIMRVMSRLSATDIQIKDGDYTYGGSLVVRYARDEHTGQLMIEVDPKLVALFQATKWSHIDWEERQALGQDHLAKWLHAFYSSHAEAYPIKVRTLQKWSGASTEELWKFRQQLREAMTRVAQVTGWAWEIDRNDCLHVRKSKALPEPE